MHLLIVESPAKSKTIEKYLAKLPAWKHTNFKVLASFGHIRDLPKDKDAIDEKTFEARYVPLERSADNVRTLAAAAKKADHIWLATDLDREGEAIAWHLREVLRLPRTKYSRIVFAEITPQALDHALAHPRDIDMNLVDAQQARRVLDRLVGFKITQVLWKHVAYEPNVKHATGRVQAAVLDLAMKREHEIAKFQPAPYWTVRAEWDKELAGEEFQLVGKNNAPIAFENAPEVEKFLQKLTAEFYIAPEDIHTKTRSSKPPAPFITSTLQQEANNKLSYGLQRTMRVAQKLYEAGKITYHRTDNRNLSQNAQKAITDYVLKHHGPEYLSNQSARGAQNTKGAQEAHEAIRPTRFDDPTPCKDPEQQRLYDLIRRRAIASMMSPAVYDVLQIRVRNKSMPADYAFLGKYEQVRFPGFLAVAQPEAVKQKAARAAAAFGNYEKPGSVPWKHVSTRQQWTSPPSRYTESSMVKVLEQEGIGRPSTYASIMQKLLEKMYLILQNTPAVMAEHTNYVLRPKGKLVGVKTQEVAQQGEANRLTPTDAGKFVHEFLVKYFALFTDVEFTRDVEAQLDQIAENQRNYRTVVKSIYQPLMQLVEAAPKPANKDRAALAEKRPETKLKVGGQDHLVRMARYGPVIQWTEPGADKPTYLPITAYLKMRGIGIPDMGATDVEFLRSFPVTHPKHQHIEIRWGPYGFYAHDGNTGSNRRMFVNKKNILDYDVEQVIACYYEKDKEGTKSGTPRPKVRKNKAGRQA